MSWVLAVAFCLVAAACTADEGPRLEYTVELEVRDGWVREPGTGCSGSRPFLYVHRGAGYRVEEQDSGEVLASGTLPEGRAVEALRENLGVPRVPTFCVFTFTLGLPEQGDFRFVLEDGAPLPFSAGESSNPVTLIIQ